MARNDRVFIRILNDNSSLILNEIMSIFNVGVILVILLSEIDFTGNIQEYQVRTFFNYKIYLI